MISEERIESLAEDKGLCDIGHSSKGERIITWFDENLTPFARAIEAEVAVPLEARIKQQEKEITRLTTVPMKYRRMEFNAQLQEENKQQSERIKELEGQLLLTDITVAAQLIAFNKKEAELQHTRAEELQAENEKLRDENAALALQNKQMREIFQSVMVENSDSPLGTIALWCVSEALALPDLSISIIQQRDNEVIERCAGVCEKADRYRGDYFAEKLRALKQ